METTVTRRVEMPPKQLWGSLTAIRDYPAHIGSYVSVEFLTDGETRVGTRWRQVRTVFGRQHAQVMRVDVWDPPHELATSATESGARYTVRYRLEPSDGGTSLEMRFGVEATNAVAKLFQGLFGRRALESTRAAMERDLDELIAWGASRGDG